jgi:hypothetical protein
MRKMAAVVRIILRRSGPDISSSSPIMPRIIIGSRSDHWPGCSEGAPGAFCARAIDPANAPASKNFEPARIFACAGPTQHDLCRSSGETGNQPRSLAVFDDASWPNVDKHGAVLGLVQDEPALRAGAASGIQDKACARRSTGGRSAPRNGPLDLTKECNLDLGVRTGDIEPR